MTTKFSFEITAVFEKEGYMSVTYHGEGYTPVEVGVPLPTLEQTDEDVIRQYVPYTAWELQDFKKIPRRVPEIGTRGLIDLAAPVTEVTAPTLGYEVTKVQL